MNNVFRETGTGEDQRPTPDGDFDGTTRSGAVRGLLLAAKRDRRKRLLKRLRRPLIERVADALRLFAFAGIIWTGPRLTPQQAADILRPNQTRFPAPCERCDGPYIYVTPGRPTLEFPPFPPARRLDGTLLSQPVQTYGSPVGTHHRGGHR